MITRKRLLIAGALLLTMVAGAGALLALHARRLAPGVHEKFAGKRWELPARIYARPLELYPGRRLSLDGLARELTLMEYRRAEALDGPGCFALAEDGVNIYSRPFEFDDDKARAVRLRVTVSGGRVKGLTDVETGSALEMVRLDPALIASIYPTHNEDRVLVRLAEAPPLLIQTLLAVEDRIFYRHRGIAPLSILRAFWENLKQFRAAQGGSTLTQQLVKNFFLTHERTFRRKLDEAIMALILEANYEKDEILEAYLNEVFLGQDGSRAIHGFGLASRFYFGRPLADLRPREIALLVGMLKGPSYYDPRRYPERAAERRNQVLGIMAGLKLITEETAAEAEGRDLGVIPPGHSGDTPFPAFLELVRWRLLESYAEEDLRTEGLRIFTTLDPQAQFALEAALTEGLADLEKQKGMPENSLEGGGVMLSTGGSEVVALVGGRDPRFAGFNRALSARRPIGSLIKPAIYLTALSMPDKYHLITPLDDGMTRIDDPEKGGDWIPRNYDRRYHGIVPLYQALVHSYNSATVRLGMALGLDRVGETLSGMGFERETPLYPSSLLGAIEMTPFEVARMYQALASGGFQSPARAVLSVYRPDGASLSRYPVSVRQNLDPSAIFLVNKVLQAVVTEGTARSLPGLLSRNLSPAGKTGTTNDLKDSWFAGFTADRLAVVWVGRDDNTPAGLTGASGALRIWAAAMDAAADAPLSPPQPENIAWAAVDPILGLRTEGDCPGAIAIPFISGSEPKGFISCKPEPVPDDAPPEDAGAGDAGAPPTPDSKTRSPFLQWLEDNL